jgi:hypothetical protein
VGLIASKIFKYIGKVCWQKHKEFCSRKMPALLTLATLGKATQRKIILIDKTGEAAKFLTFLPNANGP